MNDLNFFSHTKINNRLYQVVESYAPCVDPGLGNGSRFNIYVVIGDDKVAVIDSGLGAVSGLRSYIEKFIVCDKPMFCCLTHTHPDHVGGAMLFDEVWINSNEIRDLDWNTDLERKLSDLELFADYNQEIIDYCKENFVRQPLNRYLIIEDGDSFDLGDVQLDVIRIPGHTHGSVGYYNRKENYILSGDCIQILNSYRGDIDALIEYSVALKRFIAMIPSDITIYSGHDDVAHSKEVPIAMQKGLQDVIDGNNLENDIPRPSRFKMSKDNHKPFMHSIENIKIVYDSKKVKPG